MVEERSLVGNLVSILKGFNFLHIDDLVTGWSGTVSNSKLPSEKLVKDSLDGKVSVSDVKDNLVSSDTNKPLSANQGRVLKGLVDSKIKFEYFPFDLQSLLDDGLITDLYDINLELLESINSGYTDYDPNDLDINTIYLAYKDYSELPSQINNGSDALRKFIYTGSAFEEIGLSDEEIMLKLNQFEDINFEIANNSLTNMIMYGMENDSEW